MKVADSVMMLGVFVGVLMAPTPYQITLSYAEIAVKRRFSFAFMSPDPGSRFPRLKTHDSLAAAWLQALPRGVLTRWVAL